MFQWLKPKEVLGETDIDKGLRMLLYDGASAQVMTILSTGAFLIAYALLMGASNKAIGLLAAVGPVSQILQIPAIYLVEHIRLRKVLMLVSTTVSRVSLIFVALLPWLVPSDHRLAVFLLLLFSYFGFGAVGGCAFNSWIRDLIPEHRMSSFFAKRLALATLFGAVISLLGGIGVDVYEKRAGEAMEAYGFLFVIASAAGLISIFFIGRIPEPRMPDERDTSLREVLIKPLRDANYRHLLVFLGVWSFAVNFAGPFFAVYLIRRLGMSMAWVLGLSVLSQLFNVLFFGLWGRLADRFSNKSVLMFCVPLFFFSFLMWPFTTMPERYMLTVPLLVAIHVLSGISTAGVALCAGNLALKSAPYGKAAAYLAMNALISGIAATVSPIVAGLAADSFESYELRMTLSFVNTLRASPVLNLRTLDLKGLDFVFLIGFVFGLYSLHRLLAVREEGEVTDEVLRQAIFAEMRRWVRQVSTVAGMRQLVTFPFAFLENARK